MLANYTSAFHDFTPQSSHLGIRGGPQHIYQIGHDVRIKLEDGINNHGT